MRSQDCKQFAPLGAAARATSRVYLGLVLSISACAIFTGPELAIEFEVLASEHPGQLSDETVSVEPGTHTIVIEGTIFTPLVCEGLRAEGKREGSSVGLRVISSPPTTGGCPDVTGRHTYRVVIQDLEPGVYDLRVEHDNSSPEAFPTRTLFHEDVPVR